MLHILVPKSWFPTIYVLKSAKNIWWFQKEFGDACVNMQLHISLREWPMFGWLHCWLSQDGWAKNTDFDVKGSWNKTVSLCAAHMAWRISHQAVTFYGTFLLFHSAVKSCEYYIAGNPPKICSWYPNESHIFVKNQSPSSRQEPGRN